MKKKVGVFGGTFNPIHNGHLQIAATLKPLFGLSRIFFVVAAEPPHKSPEGIAPLVHRYAMVSLATTTRADFIPSLVELDPPASPFSLDTMDKLSQKHDLRDSDLYFIAGGDSLREVCDWHRSAALLTRFNFIFVARPGVAVDIPPVGFPPEAIPRLRDLTGAGCEGLPSKLGKKSRNRRPGIYLVDIEAPDIASSDIRRRAAAGKSYRRLVPDLVYQYIRKQHLYGER